MKKLKGHKPGCKCVGCSADTRRRGMKALGLSKSAPRSAKKRAKMVRAAVKKLAKMKKYPNPKRRSRRPADYGLKITRAILKRDRAEGVRKLRAAKKRRHANPAGNLIGTSPVLHVRGRAFSFPGARLVTGSNPHRANVVGIRGRRYPMNHRVLCIDYRNDGKAMRAYGRIAPFRHKFTSEARIISAGSGKIVIECRSTIWEKQI